MKVVRAQSLGMCFGVRDALAATRAVAEPTSVAIFGELVHNETVLHELAERGFCQIAESARDEVPRSPTVLITAHGISRRQQSRLVKDGKQLIDTTCPLVRRVHEAATRLADEGYFVLVIGRRGHVEVEGVTGDLPSHDVIQSPSDVREYVSRRLGVVCQSTATPAAVAEIYAEIERRNPGAEIRLIDTICEPTRRRQQAMHELVPQVEAVVVVGGRNSNNTRQLVDFCRQRSVPAVHVQTADDLDANWLREFTTVGLTAGTSTLPETLEAVYEALIRFPADVGQIAKEATREAPYTQGDADPAGA